MLSWNRTWEVVMICDDNTRGTVLFIMLFVIICYIICPCCCNLVNLPFVWVGVAMKSHDVKWYLSLNSPQCAEHFDMSHGHVGLTFWWACPWCHITSLNCWHIIFWCKFLTLSIFDGRIHDITWRSEEETLRGTRLKREPILIWVKPVWL